MISFERPQPAEMINEVIINYRAQGERKDTSVTIQDLANIQSQQGIVSQTLNYIGIDTPEIASRVGMRELKQHSTPFAQIQFKTNRDGWNIDPGGVVKFSWGRYGISEMPIRILSVKDTSNHSGDIIVNAMEDIFGLPTTSYLGNQPTGWVEPVTSPLNSPNQRLFELPYWDIQLNASIGDASAVTEDSAFLQGVAQKPDQPSSNFEFWTAEVGGSYENSASGQWAGYAELTSNISYLDDTIISIKNADSILSFINVDTYAYIDNEVIRIDAIDLTGNTIDIGRGCLDTVAEEHTADTAIYFSEERNASYGTEYFDAEQRKGKFLTKTGIGILNLSSANESTITFVGRQNKPYPPGTFRINTLAYPTAHFADTDLLTASWTHRDRLLQLARPIVDESEGSIGPEPSTTYTLEFYDEDDVLKKTATGETGTSYQWATEVTDSGHGRLNETVRIKLWSVRSTYSSYQTHEFTITRDMTPFNLVAPVASGTPSIGSTLSCTDGTWEFSPSSYTYQWKRDTVNIPSETNNTYLVAAPDSGATLTCEVTAINAVGSTPQISNGISIP